MNWIRYKEQKPEIGQLVLVYREENKRVDVVKIRKDFNWENVTHWQPVEFPNNKRESALDSFKRKSQELMDNFNPEEFNKWLIEHRAKVRDSFYKRAVEILNSIAEENNVKLVFVKDNKDKVLQIMSEYYTVNYTDDEIKEMYKGRSCAYHCPDDTPHTREVYVGEYENDNEFILSTLHEIGHFHNIEGRVPLRSEVDAWEFAYLKGLEYSEELNLFMKEDFMYIFKCLKSKGI